MSFFGLKQGQDLENQAALPHQDIPRCNPSPPLPPTGTGFGYCFSFVEYITVWRRKIEVETQRRDLKETSK